LMTAD
jgi:SARP family transcriptional regulator, regulator of embCAB operon